MKKWIALPFLLSVIVARGQQGQDYVRKMYQRYAGKWYTTLTFDQTTKVYRNDSLIRTSLWHEALKFPYTIRIDTDPAQGNGVIYTKDSAYIFRGNEVKRVVAGGNPFMFFLGGMYQLPLDTVIGQFREKGYDLSKTMETTWDGHKVFVIGANQTDSSGNSLWVDARDLYVVRQIEMDNDLRLDARMSGQQKLGNGWSETYVDIFGNGKRIQTESYANLKIAPPVEDAVFDVRDLKKGRWFDKSN